MCAQATRMALIAATGATYESMNDVRAIVVVKNVSQYFAIGVASPFVIPKLGTFRLLALLTASIVSRSPRPKLIAMSRSFGVIIFIRLCTTPLLPTGAWHRNPGAQVRMRASLQATRR